MYKRLLSVLEYPKCDNIDIDIKDEQSLRNLVIWLEVNKIKSAKANLLNNLKNINSKDWNKSFDEYKNLLDCPVLDSLNEEVYWLLGKAVQIETVKNKATYLKQAVDNIKISNIPNLTTENPLDTIDFKSKEFTDGINKIAKTLNVVSHPDPTVTLDAVRKVICTRFTHDRVENPNKYKVTGAPFPFEETDLGFDLNDNVLNQAAKVLRMLYINDLRLLQTNANELIVAVQNVTANPKTDTRLGKVGR